MTRNDWVGLSPVAKSGSYGNNTPLQIQGTRDELKRASLPGLGAGQDPTVSVQKHQYERIGSSVTGLVLSGVSRSLGSTVGVQRLSAVVPRRIPGPFVGLPDRMDAAQEIGSPGRVR